MDDMDPDSPPQQFFCVHPANKPLVERGQGRPAPDRRIGDYRIGGWVALMVGLVMAGLCAFSWNYVFEWQRHGAVVSGTVLEHQLSGKKKRLKFSYLPALSPRLQVVEQFVSTRVFYSAPDGTTLPVRYRVDQPEKARPEADFQSYTHQSPIYSLIGAIALLGMAAATMITAGVLGRRDRLLLLQHTLLPGRILAAGILKNEAWVRYSFTSPFGEAHEARYGYIKDGREPPEPGTWLKVAYQSPRNFRPL